MRFPLLGVGFDVREQERQRRARRPHPRLAPHAQQRYDGTPQPLPDFFTLEHALGTGWHPEAVMTVAPVAGGPLRRSTAGCSSGTRTRRGCGAAALGRRGGGAGPTTAASWLHHREMTDDGPKLCRSENFVPFHDGLRALLTTGPMLDTASALLGEPAVLYKEKINYKLPGGAGYAPHQDAPAYRFVETPRVAAWSRSTTPRSPTAASRWCRAAHHELLPIDDAAASAPTSSPRSTGRRCEVRAGETLWFHSRTPHRSGPNHSAPRRGGRCTRPTTRAAEGDLREPPTTAQKLAEFAARRRRRRRRAGVAHRRLPGPAGRDDGARPVGRRGAARSTSVGRRALRRGR